jgi:hypothetical protein
MDQRQGEAKKQSECEAFEKDYQQQFKKKVRQGKARPEYFQAYFQSAYQRHRCFLDGGNYATCMAIPVPNDD